VTSKSLCDGPETAYLIWCWVVLVATDHWSGTEWQLS